MISQDPVLDQYYALKPAQYGLLESINLRQSVQPLEWHGFEVAIRLSASTESNSKYLQLSFQGVQDFRMGPLQGLMRYVVDIRSLTETQQEVRYKVVESEHDAFSFVCTDILATVSG